MRRTSVFSLVLMLATLTVSATALAQGVTPSLLNYQGLLADSNGEPINAQGLIVTFKIWDDPLSTEPGALKWEETLSIDVADGLFNVILGETVPINEEVFATSQSYLGLTIQGEPESTPRTRLVSVGYSTRVETVDGARGGVISGTVGVEGTNDKGNDAEEVLRIELFGDDGIQKFWASETEVLTPCVLFSADSSLQCTAAINSGVAQAENGASSVVVSTELTDILSQTIDCPSDGFVMVMGSFEAEGNVYDEYSITLLAGVSNMVDALPADQNKRWTVYDGWDKTYHLHRNVISLSRIFPVSAGGNTFHILGQRTEGNHDFVISQSTLSLVFIPKAYGAVGDLEIQAGVAGSPTTPRVIGTPPASMPVQVSAAASELKRQAAEISLLKEQIAELKAIMQVRDSNNGR